MDTTAIIPHKDTFFFLGKVQKEILEKYNSSHEKNEWLIPQYPLWFTGCDFIAEETSPESFVIQKPLMQEGEIFFPVEINFSGKTFKGKIILAKKIYEDFSFKDDEIVLSEENEKKFPLSQKSFRFCNVSFESNGWKVIDEKWFKCL